MPFGETLRTAREKAGLTASQLAQSTHLLVQLVEGLEKEDFRRIPAPIYGRGFVKIYCETVGLDPKPMQEEFMRLYTAKKDGASAAPAAASVPPPAPSPAPAAAPVPPPAPSPEPVQDAIPEPEPQAPAEEAAVPEPEPQPTPAPAAEPPPPVPQQEVLTEQTPVEPRTFDPQPRKSYGELFEQAYANEAKNKPSAAEKFRDTMSNVSHGVFANVKKLPPNTGRMIIVAVSAIVLLALMAWGLSILYSATSRQPADAPSAKPAMAPAKDSAAAPAKKPAAAQVKKPEAAPPKKPVADQVKKPAVVPAKKNAVTPTKTKPAKPSTGSKAAAGTVKPEDLKQSGIEVPPLYIN